MATNQQRLKSICDALINANATTAQINRYAVAVADAEGLLWQYNAATTNADKAAIVVGILRKHALAAIKSHERQAAVASAATTADSQVDADFNEQP